jgi:hypothetical protein
MKKLLLAVILLSAAFAFAQTAQPDWAVVKTFQIGGDGAWDYLTVDPGTHRLYVPRSTHTQVIDAESGQVIGDIPGQKRAHGAAIVPDVNRGFISDGGDTGFIDVFDLKTNALLGKISALPDADGIIYDPYSKQVLVVSGDKGVLMTLKPNVNPKTGTIGPPIDLGGAPEFLASDGKGKIYINLMDKNEVAVVDIKARKVIARWPVAPGGAPVGMSMSVDGQKRRLFIGCRKPPKLIVMSAVDGKILADLPIGEGVDATKYLEGYALASCRDGTLAVAHETSPEKFEIVQTVQTPIGARTMGVDPTTYRIYLPTATFEEAKPGERPRPKPGTFVVVVVGHQAAK